MSKANSSQSGLAITRLEVRNYQRVRLARVKLSPTGLTVIKGKNGQGKTSLFNAIADALGVADRDPARRVVRPVQTGAAAAKVRLELAPQESPDEPQFVVQKTITSKGEYLRVTDARGAAYSKPQQLLDALLGRLGAFNPLDFVRMRPDEQRQELLRLIEWPDITADLARLEIAVGDGQTPLDALDAAVNEAYEYRTQVNRDLRRSQQALDALHLPQGWRTMRQPDITGLLAERDRLSRQSREWQEAQLAVERASAAAHESRERVIQLEAALLAARKRLESDEAQLEAAKNRLSGLSEPDASELARIDAELAQAQTTSAVWARIEQARALEHDRAMAEAESERLTGRIEAINRLKARLAAEAKAPIPGLAHDPTLGVTYNGQPLSQCSHSEQIRVGLALAYASNPKLRFVRCPETMLDGLDADNLRQLEDDLARYGFQLLAEQVLRDESDGLIIEDGELDADNNKED